jgi:hypothetical protein
MTSPPPPHPGPPQQACVAECLAAGATGVWAAICDEGAACGHAGSLGTLANLARLGNAHVPAMYRLPALRRAAVQITRLSTGADPHPGKELYGARALDACWPEPAGGAAPPPLHGPLARGAAQLLLEAAQPGTCRVSTLASPGMVAARLRQEFGAAPGGGGGEWPLEVARRMLEQLRQDLLAGGRPCCCCLGALPACMLAAWLLLPVATLGWAGAAQRAAARPVRFGLAWRELAGLAALAGCQGLGASLGVLLGGLCSCQAQA